MLQQDGWTEDEPEDVIPRPETGFRKKNPPVRNQVILRIVACQWVLGTVGFGDVFVFISGMTRTTGAKISRGKAEGFARLPSSFDSFPLRPTYVLNRYTCPPTPRLVNPKPTAQ